MPDIWSRSTLDKIIFPVIWIYKVKEHFNEVWNKFCMLDSSCLERSVRKLLKGRKNFLLKLVTSTTVKSEEKAMNKLLGVSVVVVNALFWVIRHYCFSAEFSSMKSASRPRFYCDLHSWLLNTSGVLARNYSYYDYF